MAPLTIDVYSDVICPWCYVGKKNLERAVEALPREVDLRVQYHPFELNPQTPEKGVDRKKYLAERYGTRIEQAHQSLRGLGTEVGIDFQFDLAEKIPNTFKAHRLLWWARKKGRQEELADRLFRAYFSQGLDLGDSEVLSRLASECGLEPDETRRLLEGREGEAEVRLSETQSQKMGIHGVPHFVIGKTHLSGAQPPETLAQVILEEAEA